MNFDVLDRYSHTFRHPMGYRHDELILRVLGDRLVRYLLAAEDGADTPAIIEATDPKLVEALGNLAETVTRGKNDMDSIANQLAIFVPETDTSLGNSLRLRAGGQLPVAPPHDDRVTRSLLAIARDEWPRLLLPPDRRPWWPLPSYGVRGGIYESHPHRRVLIQEALADPCIAEAFPTFITASDPLTGADEVTDAVGDWVSSTGTGGTQYLSMVLGNLIAMSGFRALSLDQGLSLEGLCGQLPEAVEGFRRLAVGEEVAIPVVVGLSGLEIESATGIHVKGGTLRSALELERSWYFLDSEDVRSVFVFEAPVKWARVARPEDDSDHDRWIRDFERESKRIRIQASRDPVSTLQSAVLLTGDDEQMQTLAERGRFVFEPSGQGPWTMANRQVHPTSHRHQHGEVRRLSEDESETAEWLSRLEPKQVGNLSLALEKATQAAVERHRPEDRLLDAIIGLESLVGGPTELTFRVSLAVAWALAPESTHERREIQEAVRSLYKTRSSLVHGSRSKSGSLDDDADRALAVLLRLLRVLLRDRPDLVAMTTADQRSAALTLGIQRTGPEPLADQDNQEGISQ